jgi:hypothetical protein
MPYVLVVGKMRRAFEEARDVASLPSTLEIVFRTCYIRHFDEELNPEGLEHCGSDFQVKWDKCIEDIGWWYSVSGPCTLLAGIIALL